MACRRRKQAAVTGLKAGAGETGMGFSAWIVAASRGWTGLRASRYCVARMAKATQDALATSAFRDA